MSFPQTDKEIPIGRSYAILAPKTVTIPGDLRSRTNPGHGYPEHTESSWDIQLFDTQEKWEEEIKTLSTRIYARKGWVAVIFNRPSIKQTISIEVEVDEN